MSKIKVAVFRPGQDVSFEEVENKLQALQGLVEGYIEMVGLHPGLALICNEEGKLKGLPVNRRAGPELIVGTFFIARLKGADFISLTPEDEALIKMADEGFFLTL